ncbi:MAG: saccharopine dehydrogenase NADP-binding domain-containing protein, partial [Planctomycetia bacterium]|nr:saccharopine dehydrogenase NADP-binding domain-containing protein [Planctomycetia bacterium]
MGHAPLVASRRAGADLVLDAEDPASLRAALRPGDVILDAAGPFQRRSTALVEAAIDRRCDVVDLADGLHYVDQSVGRGMKIDDFAPRLSFFFNSHNDIFEEVAKYRAARAIWADAMRNRYAAKDEASWKLRCHA